MVEVYTVKDAESIVSKWRSNHPFPPEDYDKLLAHAGDRSCHGQAAECREEAEALYKQLKEERPELAKQLIALDDAYSNHTTVLADIAYRLGIAAGRLTR